MTSTTTHPLPLPCTLHQLVVYEQLLEGQEIWSQRWIQREKQIFYYHLIKSKEARKCPPPEHLVSHAAPSEMFPLRSL